MTNPYYQDSHVTIYHKDCSDMSEVEDGSVDLALTDPPYVGVKGGLKQKDYGVAKHFNASYTVGDIWGASFDWVTIAWGKVRLGMQVFCSFHNVAELKSVVDGKAIALVTWHKRNAPPSV